VTSRPLTSVRWPIRQLQNPALLTSCSLWIHSSWRLPWHHFRRSSSTAATQVMRYVVGPLRTNGFHCILSGTEPATVMLSTPLIGMRHTHSWSAGRRACSWCGMAITWRRWQHRRRRMTPRRRA
jgi:hypothetical protein